MAKSKLTWEVQNNGNRLQATILASQTVVHFDLTKLQGWDKISEHLDSCPVARDSFYAGMFKKLAQPTGGTAILPSKYAETMEALFKSIVETNSYAQRKKAAEKVEVGPLVANLQGMLEREEIDEATYELMLSTIGQARVAK